MTAELLGSFHGQPHLAGRAVVVATAALVVLLGRLQLAWRDLEARTWWASNARDLLNLVAVASLTVALFLLGMPVAAAALWASQLVLAEVMLEALILRRPALPHPDVLAIAAASLLALPLAMRPEEAVELLNRLAARIL